MPFFDHDDPEPSESGPRGHFPRASLRCLAAAFAASALLAACSSHAAPAPATDTRATPEGPLDSGASGRNHDSGPGVDAADAANADSGAACNTLALGGAPLLPQIAVAGSML